MAHDSHTEGHDEHTGHGAHHVFDAATLKKTFGILVGLTLLTVILALFERGFVAAETFGFEFALPFKLPLGALSVPIALGIAGVKVYWVASRFMGLKYEGGTNTLVFLGSASFLLIFFGFTWLDFAYRDAFEELAGVPTDIVAEEILEAEAIEASLPDDAVPLVNTTPDAGLFGTAPTPTPAPEPVPADAP